MARLRDVAASVPPPPDDSPSVPGYTILDKIGEGGMGMVFLARDDVLGRKVAVKIISRLAPEDDQARRRFLNEAKSMASVVHPNVVHLYGYGAVDGDPYLIMEYVEGERLSTRLHKAGPLSQDEAIEVVKQTIAALEAASEQGLVHRDVKPGNILIDEQGVVRVCDFGLAKPARADLSSAPTSPEPPRGTPHYMSPEQASGQATDLRSDIYSLGIVLYEMLVGRPPFDDESPYEAMTKRREKALPSLDSSEREISEEVVDLYEWMTQREPAERPGSYAALRERVESLGAQAQVRLLASTPWWRRLAYVALAALLVAAVVGAVFLRESEPPFARMIEVADFEDRTGDANLEYLSHGFKQAIQDGLIGGLDGYIVIPTDWRANPDFSESEVRADLQLAGSFTHDADHLRVDFELRDLRQGQGGSHGSGSVRGDVDDVIALQDRLVTAVVGRLHDEFGTVEFVARQRPTDNQQASIAYQRGTDYLERAATRENVERAVAFLERAISLDRGFARAYAALGQALSRKYDLTRDSALLARAGTNCDQAARLDSQLADAHVCDGRVNIALGRYSMAAEDFIRAVELGDAVRGHRGLGHVYTLLGNDDEAERYLLDAWRQDPAYPGAYLSLGWFYTLAGRYEEATEWYRQAVDWAPDSSRAYTSLAAMHYWRGRYEDCVETARQSVEVRDNADAYSNLGQCQLLLGDLDEAVTAFARSVELDDSRYLLFGNLGRAHHLRGDRAEAAASFEEAARLASEELAVNPDDPNPRMVRAYYRVMLGEVEAGLRDVERVLAAEHTPNEAHFWAAMIRLEQNQVEAAIAHLETAIEEGYSIHEIRDAPEFERGLADRDAYRRLIGES